MHLVGGFCPSHKVARKKEQRNRVDFSRAWNTGLNVLASCIIAISTLAQLLFGEDLNAFHVLVLAAAIIEVAIARYFFTATLHEIDGLESKALWISMGLICLLILGCLSVSLLQAFHSATENFLASALIETASRSAILFVLFAVWFAFPAWRKRHTFPSVFHFRRRSKPRPLQRSVYEAVFQD